MHYGIALPRISFTTGATELLPKCANQTPLPLVSDATPLPLVGKLSDLKYTKERI